MGVFSLRTLYVCLIFLSFCTEIFARGGGGCFLPETPILLANGKTIAIRFVRPQDKVKAYDSYGKIVVTTVRAVITHQVDSYYAVTTGKVTLQVTGEHPFYIGKGHFKSIVALHPGDNIYALKGKKLSPQAILHIEKVSKSTTVYNLQTYEPHTYFAQGIAVHNKGGGGGRGGGFSGGRGRHGHGHGSGKWDRSDTIAILLYVGLVLVLIWGDDRFFSRWKNLDYLYSESQVQPKSEKTMKLLNFIAQQDEMFLPKNLISQTSSTFKMLQSCWMERDYSKMRALMMPDLFEQHNLQIEGMKRQHEINCLGDISILRIDLVNIRYTEKKDQREFTALITAQGTDYYIDDRTQKYIRGDKSPAAFQEFWTFHLLDNRWLLREIEQTRESSILKEENFIEQFTDSQVEKIYQDSVDKLGASGPWVAKSVELKETKVERMLNFLVNSDKIWDQAQMLRRVREIFTKVHLALETGVINPELLDMIYPEIAKKFAEKLTEWREKNETIEYRNFCVRKVSIVLVHSYDDKSKDEFVSRVSAHAQRVQLRDGIVIEKDIDVTPFEEFWTFGRLDGQWKLKEALPKAAGKEAIDSENSEQGSTLNLIKWYYTKKRAL